MAISLTPAAAEHVAHRLAERGKGLGLRLSTKKSGCSGFAYVVDYADEVTADDHVVEDSGIKVVVDDRSLGLVDGTEIDYEKCNLLFSGFEFRNPNVKEMCGCGESFHT